MARFLDGVGDYLRTASVIPGGNGSKITIAGFVYYPTGSNAATFDRIVELGGFGTGHGGVGIEFSDADNARLVIWDTAGGSVATGTFFVPRNIWIPLVILSDDTAGARRHVVYFDGLHRAGDGSFNRGNLDARITLGSQNNSPGNNDPPIRVARWGIWTGLWNEEDFSRFHGGVDPTTIRTGDLLRYWGIAGAASPEPEANGNEGLTVGGNANAVADPTFTTPRISTVFAYVVHGPNERRVSTAFAYVVEGESLLPNQPEIEASATAPNQVTVEYASPSSNADEHRLYASLVAADLDDPQLANLIDTQGAVPDPIVVNGLTTGDRWYYRAAAENPEGVTLSEIVFVDVILGAPENLVATPVSNSQIDLAWTASPFADTHEVHMSEEPDFVISGATLMNILGAAANSYSVTDLPSEATRYFRIVAVVGVQELESNEDSATTLSQPPSAPVLIEPNGGTILTGTELRISYNPGVDPEGRPVTHTARYRKVGAGSWNNAFVARSDVGPFIVDPFVNTGDGTYEIEIWATDDQGLTSDVESVEFEVNIGAPTAINILTPAMGDVRSPGNITITWIHATDPDTDPLTEFARFKKSTDGTWTDLFNQPDTDPASYVWDASLLTEGTYYLEMWANDGTSDGPITRRVFTIDIAPAPRMIMLRLLGVTTNVGVVEAFNYSHPEGLSWKAVRFQLIPVGGSWDSPTIDVVVNRTVGATTVQGTFTDLPHSTSWIVRGAAIDSADQQGPWRELFFNTEPEEVTSECAEGETLWSPGGSIGTDPRIASGVKAATNGTTIVPHQAGACLSQELVGSFVMNGMLAFDGHLDDGEPGSMWQQFWKGEHQFGGMGTAKGTPPDMDGLAIGILTHGSWPFDPVMGEFYQPPGAPLYGHVGATLRLYLPKINLRLSKALPAGIYLTHKRHFTYINDPRNWHREQAYLGTIAKRVWYNLTILVQRYFEPTVKTVFAVRINEFGPSDTYTIWPYGGASVEWNGSLWHAVWTVNNVSPCGFPAWVHAQDYAWGKGGTRWFARREHVRIPDIGQDISLVDEPPPIPEEPDPFGPCVTIPEELTEEPILFPAEPTWSSEFLDETIYPTNVITAEDDTEQRVQLREIPSRRLSFSILTQDVGDSSDLVNLLWEHTPIVWGVPYWAEATRLAADVNMAATAIPVLVTSGEYATAQYFALIRDNRTYEMVQGEVVGNEIVLAEPLLNDWDAGTMIVPVILARLVGAVKLDRPATFAAESQISFLSDGR